MTNLNEPNDSAQKRLNRKNSTTSTGTKIALLFLWCSLTFSGFYIGKAYLDKTFHDIQQTNAMNIRNIEERVETLTSEVQELKSILGNTDQVISNSGNLQADLNAKIQILDQQMQDLQKSLQILKEAP